MNKQQGLTRRGAAKDELSSVASDRAAAYKKADAEARTPEGIARRKKMEQDQGLEAVRPEEMIAGPGLKMVAGLAKKLAGAGAKSTTGGRALSTEANDGVTFLGKSGGRQVGGFPEVAGPGARQLSDGTARRSPSSIKQIGMKKGGAVKSASKSSGASRRADGMASKGKTKGRMV
jgi:hypothetical protein